MAWLGALPIDAAMAADTEPAAPTAIQAPATSAQVNYLSALQTRAREMRLAETPMWQTLLHYRRHPLTGRLRSLADDPEFFLSPQGQHDAQAELDATLAAFFDPTLRFALDQSAACRFIARHDWLRAQLKFDTDLLPEPNCARYRQWRQGIGASRVTLIFPSAYLNSPASMYGHTFLRLDPQPDARTAQGRPLLSYAINYAANGNENEGLAFAFKGLTGLYAGQFTNAPYYIRIREYNDLENRDIWEYELQLTPEEIDRLMAHTWELGPTVFDYYFFDENCSYHLLSLIDAARPELQLSAQFTWWAIPLDTIKAIARVPGLMGAVRYRPANSSELQYRAKLLGPQGAAWAKDITTGQLPLSALEAKEPSPERRALILETAERLTAYDATRRESVDSETQKQRMTLLAARAALPSGPALAVPTPRLDPTQGHDTARVDLLMGQRNGHAQVTLQARPAYHELMDTEEGYQRGAAITFFSVALSKTSTGHVQLERFVPVEIASLSPYEPLLAARSWRVHVGLERADQPRADGSRPMGLNLQGGPGLSHELGTGQRALGYLFLDNQARWDRSLPEGTWAVGSGLATGVLLDLTSGTRLQIEGFARAYLDHQPRERGLLANLRIRLDRQWNAVARCSTSKRDRAPVTQECMLGVQGYM
jgi:hypothetical protein